MEEKKGELLFGKVISLPLVEEIKHSYLDYAMSVIVGRALPDVRDGLKPVQRRILYAMMELGLRAGSSYKKSARVVGETMGKYHPHGDSAIYETMVRMAQDFSMRYPLVNGQGNFGSIDGDPAAAMRYTEAKLYEMGELMLADIEEDTVEWGPNFDESLKEPLYLPSLVPNLLVNGSSGIAVGMATNIPPHNLSEVVDALEYMIDSDGNWEFGEIYARLPGPDFPTGGIILGRDGIIDAYRTGRGKVILRGKTVVEDGKRGKTSVIITEIPFMVNKTSLIETIASCVQEKHIDGVADIRDESDRDGLRIVLELQRDGDADLVLAALQENPAPDHFRRHQPRPGEPASRRASHCGYALPLPRTPERRGPEENPVQAGQSPRPGPHRGRTCEGPGHDRPGHRAYPGCPDRSGGEGRPDFPARIFGDPGPGYP